MMGMAGKKDLLTLPGFKPQGHQALRLGTVPTTLTYPLPHLQLHMTKKYRHYKEKLTTKHNTAKVFYYVFFMK
jgi:hypothetical protein